MIVKVTESTDEEDYRSRLRIEVGGKSLDFHDREPEDSNLSRDFSDCYSIVDFMQMAYDAGVAGEPFILEEGETDDE